MVGWWRLCGCVVILLALAPWTAAAAPRRGAAAAAPDFSTVDSIAKAEALVRRHRLVPVLFYPKEFGGADDPQNRGYLPPWAAETRARLVATMTRMAEAGDVNRFAVDLGYSGDSIVPTRLTMRAWHSSRKKRGLFEPTIDVWRPRADPAPEELAPAVWITP
jgi:hypothetical protein